MQSADAVCRSLQFENLSKTFLSLPVSREQRNASVEKGPWGEPRGWPVLPYLNAGAEFSVAIQRCAPQGSLDFGYPDEPTSASVVDEISPRNRARGLLEISRDKIDIRVRRIITCQDCKTGVTEIERNLTWLLSLLHWKYLSLRIYDCVSIFDWIYLCIIF